MSKTLFEVNHMNKTTKFLVSEEELLDKLISHLTDCDSDEFARLCGEIFGGACELKYVDNPNGRKEEVYEFEPDENYWDAFGKESSFQGDK